MRRNLLVAMIAALLAAAPLADASRLHNMELLSQVDEFIGYADIWGYNAPDGREYALIGTDYGTAVYNVTVPETPLLKGFIGGPKSDWRDLKTYSTYAYVTTEGGGAGSGMQIIDLSNPDAPVLAATYKSTFSTAHNLFIDTVAARVYVVGTGSGTHILDLTNPTAPVEIGLISSPYFHDCMVRNNIFYGGAIYQGEFRIYDVASAASPTLLSATGYSGAFTHNVWPTESGAHLLSTDELADGHLRIWDIGNLSSITQVASYGAGPSGSIIHNAMVNGNSAVISYYTEGVRLLDITDPTSPQETGYYDTYLAAGTGFKGCWGVFPYTLSGAIYASDIGNGLFVVRHDPTYGNVTGTIVSAADLSPVPDARITLQAGTFDQTSISDGSFSIHTAPGSNQVLIDRYGFLPVTLPMNIVTGLDTTVSVSMTVAPKGSIAGIVRTDGGTPLAGAFVALTGVDPAIDPLEYSDTTDAAGAYTIAAVPEGTWEIEATLLGRNPSLLGAVVSAGTPSTVDFYLTASIFSDDFETDKGWTVGAPGDDATDGVWERAEPIGREIGFLVPTKDHSPGGTLCYLTEQGVLYDPIDINEVDGTTSLLSPVIDLSAAADPVVGFERFFSVNIGKNAVDGDACVTSVSSDGGVTWVTVDSLTSQLLWPARPWHRFEFRVLDYVSLTSQFRVKISITDRNADTSVESGLDDFEIIEPAVTNVAVAAAEDVAPARSRLIGNRPNPFNPTTMIFFDLSSAGKVDLDVFDASGRRVRSLFSGSMPGGTHQVLWDGRDDAGTEVGSGLYFSRLRSESGNFTKKMILIR